MTPLLFFLAVIWAINAVPVQHHIEGSEENSLPECYGMMCPPRTVACSRTIKTSRNRKTITTTVECEDDNESVLKSYKTTAENPEKNSLLQRYSFSRAVVYNGGEPLVRNFGTFNNEIEMF